MKHFAKKKAFCFCVLCLMLITAFFPCVTAMSGDNPLIEGLVMEKTFKPGTGQKVGVLRMVQGNAFTVHADNEKTAYPAAENLPLFKGDTLITLKKGRLQLELNDGSVLTVSSETRMKVARSVFDEEQKTRSSFIDMLFGKVRYVVKKYTDFDNREFKVKTRTAVMGVRGSDFIVKSGEKYTEVITLENTELEIVRLAALEEKPSVLTDFEKIVIEKDAMPSEVTKVSPEEMDQMIREMISAPESPEEISQPDAGAPVRKEEKAKDAEVPEAGESMESDTESPAVPDREMPKGMREAEAKDSGEERPAEPEGGEPEAMPMDFETEGKDMHIPKDMEEMEDSAGEPAFERDDMFDNEQAIMDAQEEIIEDNVKENISPPKTGEMITLPLPPKE